jgi:exodeoxyribonuclease VII large subunit
MSLLPFDDSRGERVPTPPTRRVLSVSELAAAIRDRLESAFPELLVEGEISGGRVWNTGHYYFTLKDAGAQIRAVMFRTSLRYLTFKPADGLRVTARGRLSVYEPKGEYQLVCELLEPQGFGALQLAFEQLKKTLAAEGLFDPSRKRPLPALPRRIGIVTSIDGAALRDVVRVLRRRYPNAHLVIAPTRVQGEGAARDIARALAAIARVDDVDVVIVGRGGGSLEDLWAFNDEAVARAIAACPVPVISGVGHETDTTIADFVADVRAATPSAAAELVVRRKDEFWAHIDRLGERLIAAATRRIGRLENRLRSLEARPGYAGVPARVAWRGRRLAEDASALREAMVTEWTRRARQFEGVRRALERFDPRHRLASVRTRLAAHDHRLSVAIVARRHDASSRFRNAAARLDGLSPLAVLGRGYAVCWDATRTRIIRDAATVSAGESLVVTVERGEIRATVDSSAGTDRT